MRLSSFHRMTMRCLACKYDLSHLTEHRCPECGQAFDPNDPATFRSEKSQHTMRSWAAGLVVLAVVVNVLLLPIGMSDGGAGWAFNFPCLLANGFLVPAAALTAAILADMQLARARGRDVIAWIVIVIAAIAVIAAVWMLLRAIEAVASV